MSRPTRLISYSQNHEDIVLARIFKPWNKKGHWIDIGAGHPKFDSVTRLFSDFGWTGINVEPLPEEYALLCQDRPNDINLNCAIGTRAGTAVLYEGPAESRGTSTLLPEIAALSTKNFAEVKKTEVEVRTLSSVVEHAPWKVDFIKIDVEGMEQEVIASADWDAIETDIIIVEATTPNSTLPTHHGWEPQLVAAGFKLCLFDGLNRYYSRDDRRELTEETSISPWYPATAQDNYVTATVIHLESEVGRITQLVRALEVEREATTKLILSLNQELATAKSEIVEASKVMADLIEKKSELNLRLGKSESERIRQQELISDLKAALGASRSRLEELAGTESPSGRRRKR